MQSQWGPSTPSVCPPQYRNKGTGPGNNKFYLIRIRKMFYKPHCVDRGLARAAWGGWRAGSRLTRLGWLL